MNDDLKELIIQCACNEEGILNTILHSKLETFDKLRFLLNHVPLVSVGYNTSNLKRVKSLQNILKISEERAKLLLNMELDASNEKLTESEDNLLSILAYVLRLTQSRILEMGYCWTIKDLFNESKQPPPWDKFGLLEYLHNNNLDGIKEALLWIRSH